MGAMSPPAPLPARFRVGPLAANLSTFLRNPLTLFEAASRSGGPLVRVPLAPGTDIYLVHRRRARRVPPPDLLSLVGHVLFGMAVGTEAPHIEDALETLMERCQRYARPLGAVLDRLPLASTRREHQGADTLNEFLDDASGPSGPAGRAWAACRPCPPSPSALGVACP